MEFDITDAVIENESKSVRKIYGHTIQHWVELFKGLALLNDKAFCDDPDNAALINIPVEIHRLTRRRVIELSRLPEIKALSLHIGLNFHEGEYYVYARRKSVQQMPEWMKDCTLEPSYAFDMFPADSIFMKWYGNTLRVSYGDSEISC